MEERQDGNVIKRDIEEEMPPNSLPPPAEAGVWGRGGPANTAERRDYGLPQRKEDTNHFTNFIT